MTDLPDFNIMGSRSGASAAHQRNLDKLQEAKENPGTWVTMSEHASDNAARNRIQAMKGWIRPDAEGEWTLGRRLLEGKGYVIVKYTHSSAE